MATVSDDVITEAGSVEEERGAGGTYPLPPADNNENNNQGDPPGYPGDDGGESGGHGSSGWSQEMAVIGTSAAARVEEPEVTFIARDETTDCWENATHTYSFGLSSSVGAVYSAFASEAGYREGTFTLLWKKQRDSTVEEEELYEKSSATLLEVGMEGGKVNLYIRDKNGIQPERLSTTTSFSTTTSQGAKVTSTALNNARTNTSSSYGNATNYSGTYGYSNYSYHSYKSETGYVGLVNQAMTCYLNSLLQTLYMTPEFRNALYQWRFNRGHGEDGVKSIPYQLQRLFVQLQTSEKRAVETTDVTKSFGWDSSEEAMQAFVEPETLTGDNQYMCENCQKKCDAHKGLKFKSFPYLLTLQLKRFDFDYTTMHRIKLNDRMTFPRILDLNGFVSQEDTPKVPEGMEERYHDFVVEVFDPRPSYHYYGRYNNASSYSNALNSSYSASNRYSATNRTSSANSSHDNNETDQGVADSNNDESTVAVSNNEGCEDQEVQGEEEGEPAGPVELTVGQRLTRGPYVYELFSIMIHSGSAIGGHYYAYIKSLTDKKWYCFNDQVVSKLNEEDIEGTFGGSDSRSRGYYSSVYTSSANAYMLMYRQIDHDRNKEFLPMEDLPEHVRRQIEEDRQRQEEKRRQEEYDRSLCKFRLFARHPVSSEMIEKKIEVQELWTLHDTVAESHRLLGLEGVVPVTRCRLVRYDDYSECLDQSFEEPERGETFSQIVGGPRTYYSFELYLEIRGEHEVFRPYNRGGLNLKVIVVNVRAGQVALPIAMRAESGWTVRELKEAISEKFCLDVGTMNLAIETYQNEGRHLSVDTSQLKNESFFKKHTVFACSDAEDFQRSFRESEMSRLIDTHVNSTLFYVTIPPPPQRRQGGQASNATQVDTASEREGKGEGEPGEREGEREGAREKEGEREGEAGEREGEREEVREKEGEREGEPGEREEEREGEGGGGGERGEREGEVFESSVDVQEGAQTATTPPKNEETGGSEIRPPASGGTPPADETIDMTRDRPLQRTIEVRIDRRRTLQDLKDMLAEYVEQPVSNFKVYRLYSNQQEYEMTRLHDQLTTVPSETRLIVRLGRALLPGEVRVRLSLLRMEEPEFCKNLMDSIVTKGMSVGEFKKQLLQEAYDQGIEHPLQLDRLRLRKKTWRMASTIYLDNQIFDKDIHTFPNFEIYVEPLKGQEPMTSPDQMQVYLRRWRPSTFSVDPPHEVILDQNSPAHLRERISTASDIPVEHVVFAKAHNSFPGEISVLDLEDDLDWNPAVVTISSMPLSIYDDGAVLYYKDGREKLMELTAEKKSEIQKQERLKSTSTTGTTSYHRYHAKERALKIYTEEDDDSGTKDETSNDGK